MKDLPRAISSAANSKVHADSRGLKSACSEAALESRSRALMTWPALRRIGWRMLSRALRHRDGRAVRCPALAPEWLDRSPGRSGERRAAPVSPRAARRASRCRRSAPISRSTSVSGLSAGAFMASQFHVAHSRHVVGVGIVAGGPYRLRRGRDALVCALVRAHRHRLLGHRSLHGRQPPRLGHSCEPDPRSPGPCARPVRPHRSAAGDSSRPRLCLHQHGRHRRQIARRRGRRGALCESRCAQVELCARAADGRPACLRHRGERRRVRQGGPGLHHRLRLRPGRCHPAPHLPRRDEARRSRRPRSPSSISDLSRAG